MSNPLVGVVPNQPKQDNFDPLQFVSTLQQLKMQKQQQARTALSQMIEIAQQTGMGDPKAMEKAAKEAGYDMSSGQMTQEQPPQPLPQGVTSNSVSQVAKSAQGSQSGAQSANPVSDQAAQKAPAGGMTQDAMSPGSGTFETFLANARRKAQAMNLSQTQQQQFQGMVSDWQMKAVNGDNEALGHLQRLGLAPFNPTMEMWNSPKGREALTAQMMGQETADQKALRIEKMSQEAALNNKFSSVAEAKRFFEGDASVRPNLSAEDFMRQAQSMRDLLEAGVPPDAARKAAMAAGSGANPWDTLPANFRSMAQQMADLRKQEVTQAGQAQQAQLGLEKQKVGLQAQQMAFEKERLTVEERSAANRVLLELDQEKNKALKDKLQFITDANYRGVKLPEGMEEATMNELAATMGAKLQENTGMIKRVLRWVSGMPGYPEFMKPGRTFEVVPTLSPEESSVINNLTGPTSPLRSNSGGGPGFVRTTR